MKGRLIVLEGTDGSGKSTQFQLLTQHLTRQAIPHKSLVFPQYDKPSSALIRMYLAGEFGPRPEDVNPYAASTFYAVDRYASMQQVWGAYYQEGGLIVTDRYTTSNAVHQGVKCPPKERADFLGWLDDLEHNKLSLPRPSLVLYLDMPTHHATRLLALRQSQTLTQGDIHEMDNGYLAACRQCALQAAQQLGWTVISCVDNVDTLRPPQDIHRDICTHIQPFLD